MYSYVFQLQAVTSGRVLFFFLLLLLWFFCALLCLSKVDVTDRRIHVACAWF